MAKKNRRPLSQSLPKCAKNATFRERGNDVDPRLAEIQRQLEVTPISAWRWPRVVLGVLQMPAMAHADEVFYNFWAIAMQGTPIFKMPYGRTDVVRNKLAMELLKSDFTHLLMLDIDHIHPTDIVQKLARWVMLDPKRKVVGGLNFRRGEPFDPCCFLKGPEGKYFPPVEWGKGLIRVDRIGTGSILIAREVFEQIEPPWFYNDYSRVWEDAWPGEDMGFSIKCEEKGIEMWVDTSCTSPHGITSWVDEGTYRTYLQTHEHKEMDYVEEKDATTA